MVLAVTAFVIAVAPQEATRVALWGLAALTYTTDFALLAGHFWGPFMHTWTLAAEAQFYIIWPPVLMSLPVSKRFAAIGAMFGLAMLFYLATIREWWLDGINPAPLMLGALLSYRPVRLPQWALCALSWQPLATMGLLSYGIYLWNVPLGMFLASLPWPVDLVLCGGGSLALAALSYLTVERWAGCAKAPLRWA